MEEFLHQEFFEWVERAANYIRSYAGGGVTVVHHNDADGLCSGALLKKLCEYCGFEAELICIEKVYPAVVEKIHSSRDGMIIYTDLGGLAADMIDKINAGKSMVLIIDHHPAKDIDSDYVHVLDPELAGISGDVFVSASSLNYIFFRAVAGEEAKKYAYIAVLGSVGDYHDRSGGVLGFDRFALEEAIDEGQVKVRFEGAKERYFIKQFGEYADVIAPRLTTLGAVGYEERAYQLGIRACFEGFDEKTLEKVEQLEKLKKEKFEQMMERLRNGELKIGEYVQWFHVGDFFYPMGVKMVGEFCQLIKDMTFLKDNLYLIGFQNQPKSIPDLGEIGWDAVKVSARAPTPLERMILRGKMPGLDYLIPKASEAVGGFADATHRIAAATVIDRGKKEEFIEAFEGLVKEYEASRG
ncbi:DHH family phosphoesterase [Archaeoglobus sp.]|uniref:single-stranded-DNA-specific exonuclease RecJ n=1 Tax=Archaeoglobus sp. TaxID=1872626 RepID=UPI0024AB5B39|nr:DHH family phosphoesterase [Archaeoglobus sp.]MDI3497100.1 single-stranded-DNA-specific exonuclease [Archaeoglobus sp.]